MSPEEEKKNRKIGLIYSLSIHTLVILLFAFLLAWKEPNPPLPEYGIELNFGVDDAGTGEVQPLTPVVDSESEEEAAPEELPTDTEELETPADVSEEVSEETTNETETFEDIESTDVVKEQEEVKEQKVEDSIEPTVKPEVIKSEEVKDIDGAEGVEGESKEAPIVNQGDKTDDTGDQGNEEGKLDERALYGKPGGGGGSSLELAGWIWDFTPKPKDTSDESGKIVFEIKIDDRGDIISIRTIEKTVSPTVEQIYKAEVEKLTFSKTDNLPPAAQSVGRITFIIKSN